MRGLKSKLMRVPNTFDFQVSQLKTKYGYKSNTDFINDEVVPLLRNSDMLRDIIGFRKRRKNDR
jgi:hypothetical protein